MARIRPAGALGMCFLLLASAGPLAMEAQSPRPAATAAAPAPTVTCDFSNPGYSGWCRVTKPLKAGQRARGLCAHVLTCLNDARCIQTYCNATTIRGGWKLEKVEGPTKAP
jgi:hypothetical protein